MPVAVFRRDGSAVSIHAPVKGATSAPFVCFFFTRFNPRSREGSDAWARPRQEAWPGFNPRSREGSDGLTRLKECEIVVSIHAPVKGATIREEYKYTS